ncbi:uncharacterized protein LOC129231617 [Uloborus diversus]|uniref:uncharacterized protein LOC129231617 n=1 Tax=Uloborus diversus TaxID=327109 RepID=UPI00240A7E93|nr:uncharacterized protein LOC129231617 [Uloborus diversus]
MSKKNLLSYVLVHFHEENNFSVLRLKDAVTPETEARFTDEVDLCTWDAEEVIHSKYGEDIYPAKFLQFGWNKKSMETTVDLLIAGTISPADVDIHQREEVPLKRKRDVVKVESTATDSARDFKKSVKRAKALEEKELLGSVKDTIKKYMEPAEQCQNCPLIQGKIDLLMKDNIVKDKEVTTLQDELVQLKTKYKIKKKELKAL